MNEETKVPQEISALIAYADERMKKLEVELSQKRIEQDQEREELRREETHAFLGDVLSQIPDALLPFVNLGCWVKDHELYSGSYWYRYLRFDVPGLAPICMVFNDAKEPVHKAWIVAGVREGYIDDLDEYIDAAYSMNDRWSSKRDVSETEFYWVLWAAKQSADQFALEQSKKEERIAKFLKRKHDIASSERIEKSKEQALFDAIKGDAIALTLLQAFVLLRDERSHFEESLNAADEALYSVEDRWSRKAADLRRQAEDADRRARDEADRLRDLQDDLNDAEKKIEKMERRW